MKRNIRILGIILMASSLSLGTLIDCNYFKGDDVELPVLTSFVVFLLACLCLCYSDNLSK